MIKGILKDVKRNPMFYYKWGWIFSVVGLLIEFWPFMIMGVILLTLAFVGDDHDDSDWMMGVDDGSESTKPSNG